MNVSDVSDRNTIFNLITRYSRAADRRNIAEFENLFWEDGGFEGGPMDGPPAQVFSTLFDTLTGKWFSATQHYVANVHLDLRGDVALGESYFVAYHRSRPTRESAEALLGEQRFAELGGDPTQLYEVVIGGRYLDRFERRQGEWRILRRRLVPDWTRSGVAESLDSAGLLQALRFRGVYGRGDPSDDWFAPHS